MIKVLEGIEEPGDEVKCENCASVVHVGSYDWQPCWYYVPYEEKPRRNYSVDCPNCYCIIYQFED